MLLTPNPIYKNNNYIFSLLFKKFVLLIMKQGKKAKAEQLIKEVFLKIALKRYSSISILILAINNIKPSVEVRALRIKGKLFIIPFSLLLNRQLSAAIKTLLYFSKNKREFRTCLAEELINSAKRRSQSMQKIVKQHKLAFQNRFFKYYRWF